MIALYYYFRIVVVMFMKKAADQIPLSTSPGVSLALAVTLALTIAIGIYPQPVIVMAQQAVRSFFM